MILSVPGLRLYQEDDIDPRTRTLILSESIDFLHAIALYRYFSDRVKLAFGIDTNLGNDVGIKTLNIVIKRVRVNNQPVAKFSVEPGKSMCEDKGYLQRVAGSYEMTLPG